MASWPSDGQNQRWSRTGHATLDGNSVFSLVPQPVIPAGASITLLYSASFTVSVLPPAGTPLRVEALVTFGNAGARGGSGASGSNIDINGDGVVDNTTTVQAGEQGESDADEAKVRTVPCRVTLDPLPAAREETNDSVTITDPGVTVTGNVTTSNPQGFDQFPRVTSTAGSWHVSVDVDGGSEGGPVCNGAGLEGTAGGDALNVIVQFDTGVPAYAAVGTHIGWYATYTCAEAADDTASACVGVGPVPPLGFVDSDYCSYTQGKFQSNANNPVASYRQTNFSTLFPGGLGIGIADGAGPKHSAA